MNRTKHEIAQSKILTCSKCGIPLNLSSGGGNPIYTSYYFCPLCGERQEKKTDYRTEHETTTIQIVKQGELRVHYISVDSDLNIRIASCDDCRGKYFICVKEKTNGVKTAYCPGHKKFIKTWDKVSWDKIPAPVTSTELRGILK